MSYLARVNALLSKAEQKRLLAAMDFTPSGRRYGPRRTEEMQTTYRGINFTPPNSVREAAVRALENYARGVAGGTEIGLGRAVQLATAAVVPPRDVLRMVNYFSRHQTDLRSPRARAGALTPGVQAWLLWGGDPGKRWAESVAAQMAAREHQPPVQKNPGARTRDGFDKTAIARTGPSAPVQHVYSVAPALLRGRVLDFGSGRGADAKALGAVPYDPHHPHAAVRRPPQGTFDTVLMTYVLNVLPPAERHAALRKAAGHVRKGGVLILSVRPQREVEATVAGGDWTRSADGHLQRDASGQRTRFQRGYTPSQLSSEVRRVLGRGFRPVRLPTPQGMVVGAWRRT